ncbi:MAG: hypothetical protein OXK81_09165 [Chloroflexota bacterium]|nr:hypothetical protein [Chloroflexota bacterium]MDE2931818.1 hypothetical protein [Chloroflexota bacterium]
MAVKDTHKAFERLIGAGYSKEMAEVLLETLDDSWDALATKSDIEAVKGDIKALEKETKADLRSLETANRTELRELELRMRLHLYAVAIMVIGVLAALELIPR